MRQKSNGKQQFIIKRAAGFLLLIFAFTGIIGICVEKKDNRIRADSGMETGMMAGSEQSGAWIFWDKSCGNEARRGSGGSEEFI